MTNQTAIAQLEPHPQEGDEIAAAVRLEMVKALGWEWIADNGGYTHPRYNPVYAEARTAVYKADRNQGGGLDFQELDAVAGQAASDMLAEMADGFAMMKEYPVGTKVMTPNWEKDGAMVEGEVVDHFRTTNPDGSNLKFGLEINIGSAVNEWILPENFDRWAVKVQG